MSWVQPKKLEVSCIVIFYKVSVLWWSICKIRHSFSYKPFEKLFLSNYLLIRISCRLWATRVSLWWLWRTFLWDSPSLQMQRMHQYHAVQRVLWHKQGKEQAPHWPWTCQTRNILQSNLITKISCFCNPKIIRSKYNLWRCVILSVIVFRLVQCEISLPLARTGFLLPNCI